ncbi:MAG: hypothetical protein QW220_06805, partial [Candidatus Bathyarchaeia archaeon]
KPYSLGESQESAPQEYVKDVKGSAFFCLSSSIRGTDITYYEKVLKAPRIFLKSIGLSESP